MMLKTKLSMQEIFIPTIPDLLLKYAFMEYVAIN